MNSDKKWKNKIKCKLCNDVIESFDRHDFKYCKCGECFVDGGHVYWRCGAHDLGNIERIFEEQDAAVSS